MIINFIICETRNKINNQFFKGKQFIAAQDELEEQIYIGTMWTNGAYRNQK